MKYKQYPSYKDSGIEWLGKIPDEWTCIRMKFLTSITTGNKDTENKVPNGKYPFFVRSKNIEKINTYGFDGEAILTAGDGDIGKIFHYVNGKFDFHQRVYMFYKFLGIDGAFMYYYLLENLSREVIKLSAKTTVDSLRLPMLQNFVISVPHPNEQYIISHYLDKATDNIDTLVSKQEKLIERLEEKKQSLISIAVTKGLNANVAMKASGIDWLGDIPKHWEINRGKFVFEEQNRPVRDIDEIVTVFRDGQVTLRSKRRTTGFTMAILEHGYQGLRKGDLVLHSMDAFAGAIGVSEDDGRSTPEYVVVKPIDDNQVEEYYANQLRIMANRGFIYILCPSVRERAPRYRFARFAETSLVTPPYEEQQKIVDYIKESTTKIDKLVAKSKKGIELLKEKRSVLISSVVTGKIDVRGLA